MKLCMCVENADTCVCVCGDILMHMTHKCTCIRMICACIWQCWWVGMYFRWWLIGLDSPQQIGERLFNGPGVTLSSGHYLTWYSTVNSQHLQGCVFCSSSNGTLEQLAHD